MGLKVTEVGNRKTERGLQLGRREEGQYRRENIRTNSIRNHISLYLAMIIHIIHTHYTTHTHSHTHTCTTLKEVMLLVLRVSHIRTVD